MRLEHGHGHLLMNRSAAMCDVAAPAIGHFVMISHELEPQMRRLAAIRRCIQTGHVAGDEAGTESLKAVALAPVPMLLVDLPSRRILEISIPLTEIVGAPRNDIVGVDAMQYLAGGPISAFPLLASGEIDGYEATRWLRLPGGQDGKVHLWAHAFDENRPPRTAVFVLDEIEGTTSPRWSTTVSGCTVLGTINADWLIDRVSADVTTLLGYDADSIVGQPFLGVVHPGDIADLLTALGHAGRGGETVIVRLRIRGPDGDWHWCRAWVAAIPQDAAFTFMLRAVDQDVAAADIAEQLRQRLARIAHVRGPH